MTDTPLDLQISAASAKAPGKARNEDTVGFLGNSMWLLDGASRDPTAPRCCDLDTTDYVHALSRAIAARVTDEHRSLTDVLADAIDQVATDHRTRCPNAQGGNGPSSTVVIARLAGDHAELLALGDSTIIVGEPTPLVLSDRRLADIGADLRRQILDAIASGAGFDHPDVIALKRQLRAAEAEARNIAGGFWVAQDDPEAAEHALIESPSAGTGRRIVLASDGLERAVSPYRLQQSHQGLLTALLADGPSACIQAVRAVEADDPYGVMHARTSRADDCTGMVWTR